MTSRPLTFFLVDDDFDDASLFQATLSDVDPTIQFAHAADGQEALDQLLSKSIIPDLIFLDLNMPRMDGKECLALIKQELDLKDIPVIMYTTSSQSQDIEQTMLQGAVCFITKPSSIRELENILSSIAESMPEDLEEALRYLSNNANTFIVC
jgi:CheY-like chemotaxis protein